MSINNGVQELSNGEFDEKIKKGIVLIDFFAEWCMPCLMMAPVVEEMSERLKGKIIFGKVNVDDNQELSSKYGVSSIPTFVVFKDGNAMINSVFQIQIDLKTAEEVITNSPLPTKLFKLEELNEQNTWVSEINAIKYYEGQL